VSFIVLRVKMISKYKLQNPDYKDEKYSSRSD